MTIKKWVLVDFGTCPKCFDDAEILTDSTDKNQFYDSDDVRCCQSHICDAKGSVFVDDGVAEIYWNEEN